VANGIVADKKDILVPLTNSLYVRGKLSDPDRFIVDIGTGFYVEKVS
jgi:prefoldin alpha subunit